MTLEEMIQEAIPRKYARFHQPVPAGENKEPVSEFKTIVKNELDKKYFVKSILYHRDGLIFNGTEIVPLANVIYTR